MAERKTNSRILDRSEQISRMVKQTAVKTKENTAEAHTEQQSAVGYADEKLHIAGKALAVKSIRIGQIGYESTRKSMSKADAAMRKAQAQKKFKQMQAVKTVQQTRKQTRSQQIKQEIQNEPMPPRSVEPTQQSISTRRAPVKAASTAVQTEKSRVLYTKPSTLERKAMPSTKTDAKAKAVDAAKRAAKQRMQRTLFWEQVSQKPVQNTAVRSVSDAFTRITKSIASGIKTTVGSSTAMMTALLAGAAVSVVIIILLALTGGMLNTGQNAGYTEVSEQVQQYRPVIQQYAAQYGMSDYVELIMAVMMQESGGTGGDPMQAAEGPFNTQYPHTPNGITDPIYSIQCGIQELKSCLEAAGAESPMDLDHISLALQGYNFGNGYISWAVDQYGGYSAANAKEFSQIQAQRHGWSSYGDVEYVPHVLRYYPYTRLNLGGGNQAIVDVALTQLGNVGGQPYWSWYGFRSHVQWCACFVSWCADQCGYIDSGLIPKHAACQDGANWFRSHGQWQANGYIPSAGDIIYFDWNGDGHTEHVGIVERVENGTVYTVEGNASNTCAQRHYPVGSSQIYGYGIPAY